MLHGLHKNSLCDHLPCLHFFPMMYYNAVIMLQKCLWQVLGLILWKTMSPSAGTQSPVQKTMSLWVFCNHPDNLKTDSKTLYYQFTKIEIYSLDVKHNQDWKNYAFFNNSQKNRHRDHTNRMSHKKPLQSNQLIVASYGTHATNYSVFGDFYAEVTKTLYM